MKTSNPILVEVTRGWLVEYFHRGAVAFVPQLGLGIALKMDDGARRGVNVAMAKVLQHLGALGGAVIDKWLEMPLKNWAGTLIGSGQPKKGWI